MEKFEEYKYHCRMCTRYYDMTKDLELGLPIGIIITILVFISNWKLGLISTCIDIALIAVFLKCKLNLVEHRMKELEYEANVLNIDGKIEELENLKNLFS